ncbi:MAG: hypothetical protein UT66_C0035G0007 [candidate division CPR2 bacterium GW2011_GWC1_39_9]|uniref:Uncharacterized protein n=1 Tax=candidate division CPR2 bacterium GW2011_GWC2_39_10 TaxID=1618345 RepID=A0A0G0LPB9_UNCC2|nr:MAG: hypothetical protein UT18_C0016G0019 [candidate division CPR2 bacterium GW2011_GWC2_39_10]KKR33674.1 MAG: hypothetical protein UT66_C0035G0007 [candidate division CPR2 bacterium GW2011_GWC1_39_9]
MGILYILPAVYKNIAGYKTVPFLQNRQHNFKTKAVIKET